MPSTLREFRQPAAPDSLHDLITTYPILNSQQRQKLLGASHSRRVQIDLQQINELIKLRDDKSRKRADELMLILLGSF